MAEISNPPALANQLTPNRRLHSPFFVKTLFAAQYEGQIDLICSSMGAELWMSRLKWPGMASFYAQKKVPYAPFTGGPTGAFRKSFNAAGGGSLGLWYIVSALTQTRPSPARTPRLHASANGP